MKTLVDRFVNMHPGLQFFAIFFAGVVWCVLLILASALISERAGISIGTGGVTASVFAAIRMMKGSAPEAWFLSLPSGFQTLIAAGIAVVFVSLMVAGIIVTVNLQKPPQLRHWGL